MNILQSITMLPKGTEITIASSFSSCLTPVSNCSAMNCVACAIRLYPLSHADSKRRVGPSHPPPLCQGDSVQGLSHVCHNDWGMLIASVGWHSRMLLNICNEWSNAHKEEFSHPKCVSLIKKQQ